MRKGLLLVSFLFLFALASAAPNWNNPYWQLNGYAPSVPSVNYTNYSGETVNFASWWTGLGGAGTQWTLLEFDNGNGTLYNASVTTNFGGSASQQLVHSGIVINSTVGSVIRWRHWVNNTATQWNATDLMTFTTVAANNFTVLDEVTGGLVGFYNVTFSNSTSTLTLTNWTSSFYINYSLPTGSQTKGVFIANGYSLMRSRYFNIGGTVNNVANVYLLSSTDFTNIYFPVRIVTPTGAGVANANVTQLKTINGVQYTLDTQYSANIANSDGLVSMYCHLGDTYVYVATADGVSQSAGAVCTSGGITITLTSSGSGYANYTITGNTTTVIVRPESYYLSQQVTNITMFINDTANSLLYWGLNITRNATVNNATGAVSQGSEVIYFVNVTNSIGGGVTGFVLNTSLYPGNYSVKAFWKSTLYPYELNNTFFYFPGNYFVIANASNINLIKGLTLLSSSLDIVTRVTIAVVVSAIGTAAVSSVTGLGSGMIAIGFLSFFAMVSFIPIGVFAVMLMIGFVIFLIRVRP